MKKVSIRELTCLACLVCLTACGPEKHADVERPDLDGIVDVEKAFAKVGTAGLQAQARNLVAAARDGRYFASISGFQGLRRDPTLTVEQLTAIQDAVGKMQSRLAERVAQGQEASRHVNALQSETEPLRE